MRVDADESDGTGAVYAAAEVDAYVDELHEIIAALRSNLQRQGEQLAALRELVHRAAEKADDIVDRPNADVLEDGRRAHRLRAAAPPDVLGRSASTGDRGSERAQAAQSSQDRIYFESLRARVREPLPERDRLS